jgi:molecular chaperone HtpG
MSKSEIKDDKYGKFYKVLTNNREKHLEAKQFKTEVDVNFTVLHFVTKRAPYDPFETNKN